MARAGMNGAALLALGALWPLGAQTGTSCIGPNASEFAVIGLPYSGQFVVNPGWLPAGPTTPFAVQPDTTVPPGLTFNANTGVLSGTPTATGTYLIDIFVYLVSDHSRMCGIKYPIIVNTPLALPAGGQLPPGNLGAGYLAPVAVNGAPYYTFKLNSGSLPPGIAYDTYYALAGTPTAQGTYAFSATVGDAMGETLTGNYSMTIGPKGSLYLTATAVNLEAPAGGAVQTFPVGVLTSDLSSVQFGVSVVGAPAWLKVAPSYGTTPAQLTVEATPGSLAYGTYQADIQVTPKGGNALTVPVTFNLLNSTVAFGAAPTAVNVSFPAGADRTQTVTTPIQVWNSGGVAVSVTAKADPLAAGPVWFTVAPAQFNLAAGQTQTFSVTVDASKVAVGAHSGMIEIHGPNNVIMVPIQLAIAAPVLQPVLTIMPQAVTACFLCDPDKNNGEDNTFGGYYGNDVINVQNPGPGSDYTVSLLGFGTGATVQPAAGNSGAREQITVNACQLGVGRHSGYLEVSAPNMTPSKVYQKLTVYIATPLDPNGPQPDPVVSKACSIVPPPWYYSSGLVMTGQSGQTAPITAQITVTGSDDNPLQFSVTPGGDAPAGLIVSPSRGVATSTPTTVTLTLDPSKAPSGLTLSDDMATVSMGGGWSAQVPQALAGAFQWVNGTAAAGQQGPAIRAATAACSPTQIVLAPTSPPTYFTQIVDWPLTIQARLVDDCGQAVGGAGVTASFSNGDPGIALALTDATTGVYSATWRPATSAASATVTLRAMMTGLSTATRQIHGSVIDDPAAPPIVTAGGVVNNLNPVLGAAVAPGTVAAIYGHNLATSVAQATAVPLPTQLAGTQVLIGGLPAPLFFVSPGQINVQVPTELAGNSAVDVMVLVNGEASIPQTIQLGAVNPGIAAYAAGRAIAQHADWSLVTPNAPARPGEEIVLYLVGMGATTTAVASGQLAPSSPLPYASVQPTVTIDGAAARVDYAGLSPDSIGLYQINCQVPPAARSGDLPMVVIQNDMAANAVTVPVGQ
jgi:uncharacterized protein (TIGR03437 family)